MSRNPYLLHDIPSQRESVLGFMDILGYKEMILASQRDGTSEETLQKLHRALTNGRNSLEGKDLPPALQEIGPVDPFALKAFTDNIVVAWPIHQDAESELGSACTSLGQFQFQMALEGFFVRGAIAIGNAYIDEIAVYGQALIDAYGGESTLARDPRIILSPSAVDAMRQHLAYYLDSSNAPQTRDVLRDADGQYFLNYLDFVLMAEAEHGPFYEEFLMHKGVVEEKLAQFSGSPPIWSKYAWVAEYHNYFCDLHPEHFSDEHRIKLELFKSRPSLISD